MRNIRADEVRGVLRKRAYEIKGDLISIVPGSKEVKVNPFESYKVNSKRGSVSPHVEFANLNLDDYSEIEAFCNKWGKLGIFESEIKVAEPSDFDRIVNNFSFSDGSSYIGMRRTGEVVPFEELNSQYHIVPKEKPVHEITAATTSHDEWTNDDFMDLPEVKPFNDKYDVIETISDFKTYCDHFKKVMEMTDIFSRRDFEAMYDRYLYKSFPDRKPSQDEAIEHMTFLLNFDIVSELENQITPILGVRDGRAVTYWRVDTLLGSLYLMLFLDITDSNTTKRCAIQKCRKWFESENPNAIYHDEVCLNRAKQATFRRKKTEEKKRREEEGKVI